MPDSKQGPCQQLHHADVLTEELSGDACSDLDLVMEPLVLGRGAACSSGAYSVAPLGAVYLPASLAPIPVKCEFPPAPIPYSADPDSLAFYSDYVYHEPAQDDACTDSNCNVALWLNDSMC